MKKIFTLFIATVVAISMFALPQETHLLKKLETNHKVSTVDANQDQMFRLAKKDFSKRQPIFELAAQKEKDVPVMQLQQKAPKVLDLVGEDFLVEPEYDDETGEWYIAVGVDGYTFRLCWFGPADSYCGSFTMVDISMEYSWGWFESQGAFYEIAFSDVEMTISEKQVGTCLKQILLEATIIDTNDNTYNLTVVHNMYTPKSIVKTALTNSQITME